MAAKRVSVSAINWAAFAERVPKSDLPQFQALKAKNDSYVRRVAAYPDAMPKINWDFYRSKIAVAGMVDNFQKSYESLQIPYPSDKGLISQINEQENEMKKDLANFSSEIDDTIQNLKRDLERLEKQIPFSEMTMEEFCLANPEGTVNVDNPTFFPHDESARAATKHVLEHGPMLPTGHH